MLRTILRCQPYGLALLLVLTITPTVLSVPDWVKDALVVPDTITVDKDAPALVLHLSNHVQMSEDGASTQAVCFAIKILTASGIQDATLRASVNDRRKVKNLSGWHIDGNGKEHKLKDEYVLQLAVGESPGFYDDEKTMMAAFPNTRTGDVIAWEYEIEEKDQRDGFYQSFVFQASLPVLATHYVVEVPHGWSLHTSSRNIEPVSYQVNGDRHEWTCGYLPYRPSEPLMPPWEYELRQVRLSCYNEKDLRATHFLDWGKVAMWATDIQRIKNPPADSIVRLASFLCEGLADPTEKLKSIVEYVRDEIRYVAVEFGEGRFQPRDALATCVNRYGDCKDKAALVRALLDAAGIKSNSVLAMTEGPVDADFPTPFQFNHVIVAVSLTELPGYDSTSKSCVGGYLFLDPTSTSTPFGSLPTELQGTRVLKVSESDTALMQLPQLAPTDRLSRCHATATLGEDYHLTAEVSVVNYGHRAGEVRYTRMHTPAAEQIKGFQQLFSESMQNVTVSDYNMGDSDDSVWTSFTLEGDYSVTKAGNMYLVKADFFHPDRPDDFIRNDRIHPVWLGSTRKQITEIDWRVPEDWQLDQSADSIDASCADAHIASNLILEDSVVQYRSTVEQKGFVLPVEDYAGVRAYNREYRKANKTRAIFIKQ